MSEEDPDGVRTLLVGLDGVSRSVLRPLFDAGRLPTLQALFDDGVAGDLDSQIPPWTPSAWPSLYTGVNPGKHGAFDFLAFDGYDWGLVNRTHVREHALWELLDRHGLSSVVVNVPVTSPPRGFDGALVPGYIAPESPTCHPEGLLEELRDELGDYRVYAPTGVEGDERAAWYRRLVEMRGRAFRHLVGEYDPDFGFLQFQQTDTVFHECPNDEAVVVDVFEAVDEELGRALDACEPDNVVVASDHGIGPVDGYEFRVNEYLRDADLLETTSGEGGMPSWTSLARERDGVDAGSSLARRLVRAAASVGITSQRVHALLSRLRLDDVVLRHVSTDTVRAATERVDFAESTAYMRSRTELGVRINRAGREPSGDVSPIEYASVREDVMRELRAARTPDGDPVFEAVVPGEECFSGPYTDDAVDIVTVPAEFDHYLSASLRGDHFGEPSESWNHKPTGIVVLAGDGVEARTDGGSTADPGRRADEGGGPTDPADGRTDAEGHPVGGVGDAHLFDVAPTVLSLLGVPPSDRMDGESLAPVDAVAPEEYAPYTRETTHITEDEDLERRLANLGYLDDTDER